MSSQLACLSYAQRMSHVRNPVDSADSLRGKERNLEHIHTLPTQLLFRFNQINGKNLVVALEMVRSEHSTSDSSQNFPSGKRNLNINMII